MTAAIESLSWTAPLRIGKVTLVTRDMARLQAFYEQMIGLTVIDCGSKSAQLGAGGRVLIALSEDQNAKPHSPHDAGLFHTAFLLPSRVDLAEWITHAAALKTPIQGASDHIVSEAIYLADPDGNGIEVYADREPSAWRAPDGRIAVATHRLDTAALMADARGQWTGAPEKTFIGHIHLQAGDLEQAAAFYGATLGLDLMATYPGANFYATGGYHHHIAANIWNSRGAQPRTEATTGLESFEIVVNDKVLFEKLTREARSMQGLRDPWNTRIEIVGA